VHVVREIAAGSEEALGRLYDQHGGTVFALARRIMSRPEDAEEVVQDVFAQVWREAARYQDERASVAGWLVMLTKARAIDKLRARRSRPDIDRAVDPAPAFEVPDAAATPEAVLLSAADATRVGVALRQLPAEQRALIDLAYFEGLSQSEIAAKTGAPLGTVKTRMRSAMQTLKAALSS
jgi:RNA polymerase sigma-70 factor (ECF subfamily)